MLINDFETWKKLKVAQTPDDEMVKCPECQGEGTIIEECAYCNHGSERICGYCGGKGSLRFGDLGRTEIDRVFSRGDYHREVIADLERLASWKQKDRIHTLVEHGYTVFVSLPARTEKTVPSPATGV